MAESWYKEWCVKCDAVNWICNGDESDLSGVDVDGFRCRSCGHIHDFNAALDEHEENDGHYVTGLEQPN